MLGLILSIFIFNLLAYKTNKLLTKQQFAHIWIFTIAFQSLVDVYIDIKYEGYWYFSENIDWISILPLTILIPPVNIIFLNWYPFNGSLKKKTLYFFYWEIFMVIYEALALLPQPWGYFHYGWWNLWYSAICDPMLLYILLTYYKWFVK